MTGIATSCVVLSTLRQAADLDFQLVVLAGACLDVDPEIHRVLTEKVFPQQAAVQTVVASHSLTGQQERARGLGAVLGGVAAGRFSPCIAGCFPFRGASGAHARLASRTVLGKLLLRA